VLATFDVAAVRQRFSSLSKGFVFLDAPGGTQVPDEVGEAIKRALAEASGNLGAPYATGDAVAEILTTAKSNAGRFLGCTADEIVFGMNMTTLAFSLSRAAGREFGAGDEILVTRLDHDGGVAPWVDLAEDKGLVVNSIDVTRDLTLDLDDLERKLSPHTRVVSFAYASNGVGTIADARAIRELAHAAGAQVWVDAVHYAAHEPIDVAEIDCDVLMCSPYKFCGPHLGIAYVKRELAETWRPYKARPSPNDPVGRRFETGTLPFELLAGFNATIDYLDSIGGVPTIRTYERTLGERFLRELPEQVTLYGPQTMEGRTPTFLINVEGVAAHSVATALAAKGIGVWFAGNWYCVGLTELLPDESVRVGFAHYNTAEEVDRLLAELDSLASSAQS
jgi:cysteine desulfurase family protein (TIGR01976 family)